MISSYWLLEEREVGAVVLMAEFVRSVLDMVEPEGVELFNGVLC